MGSTPVFLYFSFGLLKFLLRSMLLISSFVHPEVKYLNPNHCCFKFVV